MEVGAHDSYLLLLEQGEVVQRRRVLRVVDTNGLLLDCERLLEELLRLLKLALRG